MEKNKVEEIRFKGGRLIIRTGLKNPDNDRLMATVQILPWGGWQLNGRIHNEITRSEVSE